MTREADDRPIALVGLMGAGKSAVARRLGERLGVPVADLDEMIEAEEGRPIAQIFGREGEPYFRRREAELLRQALDSGVRVVACGGGIVLDRGNRALLGQRCRVVWLEVSPAQAAARLAGQAGARPLLAGDEPTARLASLLTERAPLYAEVAAASVPTDGLDPDRVAGAVLAALGDGGER